MNVAVHPRLDSLQEFLNRVDYHLAETREEKEEIFRMRYRAYLKEGAVKPSESGMTVDAYEDCANNWIFAINVDGELCGSIRISVLTSKWRTSPSAELFGDVLDPLLDAGQIIVDPTRFVADPDKAGRFPKLPLVTARLAFLACEQFDADLGLAIVRPEHNAFYRRFFRYEPLAEPRLFPGLVKPVGLLGVAYRDRREDVLGDRPFLWSSAFERRMLFKDSDARIR